MSLQKLIELSTQRVEEQNHTCYWTADGYKFDNKNLTLWYETTTNSSVTYVDSQTDLIRERLSNTSIDMSADYTLEYLQYLRSNYKTVNLFFSGGADSLTILETAINNNIAIDNIICHTCDDVDLLCNREIKQCALPVLEKYKGKFGSYEIVPTTWNDHARIYSDELSFFGNSAPIVLPFRCSYENYPFAEGSTCYIKGADKPQIVMYNKKWYAVLIDSGNTDNKKNPNIKEFWLDQMNIKSYIKDALLYREYLLSADRVDQTALQFFKPNQDQNVNGILGRSKVHNYDKQLLKNKTNTKYRSSKNVQRMADAMSNGRMDVLVNYFTAMKKFSEILPKYGHYDGFEEFGSVGKFAWFIDIDSLEVFTQQQLIPDGF
jgi:hypothetical protein